jgi:drug/metabolite transporter (DMT)-like permease
MSTQPAWAALFSILFLAEPLSWRMAVGDGLMLTAMVIVESGPRRQPPIITPDEIPGVIEK